MYNSFVSIIVSHSKLVSMAIGDQDGESFRFLDASGSRGNPEAQFFERKSEIGEILGDGSAEWGLYRDNLCIALSQKSPLTVSAPKRLKIHQPSTTKYLSSDEYAVNEETHDKPDPFLLLVGCSEIYSRLGD
jgi:hypothetical protein